ncbi:hypothetical protein BDV96DRAFT_297433 [Lophiotrema nucula]|uniref:Uncharacterized protein n=1 Tax=Lophiotrema nucula TaxID=690887 RepID=A0A6A5YKF6_9PLEO|nr:hypothetical protein BDV96DRAFT_297433 [Lophiotrema nucula]
MGWVKIVPSISALAFWLYIIAALAFFLYLAHSGFGEVVLETQALLCLMGEVSSETTRDGHICSCILASSNNRSSILLNPL